MTIIRATSTTTGQANPSPLTLSKPYRYRGNPEWFPGHPAFREIEPARAATVARQDSRKERIRQYQGLRDEGMSALEAAHEVDVRGKTAKVYERDYLASRGQQEGS